MKGSKVKKQAKTIKPDMKAIQDAFKYFLAQDIEVKKGRPKITYGEKLIFLFKTLIKYGWRDVKGVLIVPFEKVMVEPYFYYDASISPYEELPFLFKAVETDKDFYREHNMLNYEPTFSFNTDHKYSNVSEDLVFKDYTNDFLKEYLEDRLGGKYSSKNKGDEKTIQKIEVVESKNEWEGITMYINSNYNSPIKFRNGKYIKLFYTLAENQDIPSNPGLVSYFNSNDANFLYKKTNFDLSKILTNNGNRIEPSIPILLRTEQFISRAKNKASKENKILKST